MPNIAKLLALTGARRTPIDITEQAGLDLTDYQIYIKLGTGWDGWDYVADDGSDIYFLDSLGNPLYFWIEEFDKANKLARLWVKVPSIPANGKVRIYLCYGGTNPFAQYRNPREVFIFFDDFTEDPNTTGMWEVYRHANDADAEFAYDAANRRVYLTKAVEGRSCMAFMKDIATPSDGFRCVFKGGGAGPDGWAFAFYKDIDPYRTYGRSAAGGTLGLMAYNGTNRVVSMGYAIEFDAYQNTDDPSANHIALVETSKGEPFVHLGYVDTTTAVSDNATHRIEVKHYGDKTVVLVDDREVLTVTATLDKTYSGIGFGGGTGKAESEHWIEQYVALARYVDPEPTVDILPSVSLAKDMDLM